jgi:hypothetical protein
MESVIMKSGALHHGTIELRKPKFSVKSSGGIEVQEEELCAVKAQVLFKMRCECGRSWFELELPRLVKCPACDKLGLVSS